MYCEKCGNSNIETSLRCIQCGAVLFGAPKVSVSTKNEMAAATDTSQSKKQSGLSTTAHVICGWPLALIFIGGAIGGALGTVAYGINTKIYKSQMHAHIKAFLNILIGASAFVIWAVSGTFIRNTFS